MKNIFGYFIIFNIIAFCITFENQTLNNNNNCRISSDKRLNSNCVLHKVKKLFTKVFPNFNLSSLQVGSLTIVPLPDDVRPRISNLHNYNTSSFFESLTLSVVDNAEEFLHNFAIKIPLPELGINTPGVIMEELGNDSFYTEGRHKKGHKKYAAMFPLIVTLKFLTIKAMLIPIFTTVLAIKFLLLIGIVGFPLLLPLFRFCRPGGPGFITALGGLQSPPVALTQYSAAPIETIVGDYSGYSQYLSPPHNKIEYGGRNYSPDFADENSFQPVGWKNKNTYRLV